MSGDPTLFHRFYEDMLRLKWPIRLEVVEEDEPTKTLFFNAGVLNVKMEEFSENADGMRTVMGEVRTASCHPFVALLEICFRDSGEHWGTTILVPRPRKGRITLLDDREPDEFLPWLRSAERDIPGFRYAPYTYRYLDKSMRERDHHVGEDGWSL